MPTEKPILFSGPMVKAILEDRKTQTRRVVKPQPVLSPNRRYWHWPRLGGVTYWETGTEATRKWATERMYDCCPYGQPGDRLWVRETWSSIRRGAPILEHNNKPMGIYPIDPIPGCDVLYRATDDDGLTDQRFPWRPSIFMPRWASRLTLEITGVRVERVQDISKEDAIAEGVESPDVLPRSKFSKLWDDINAKRGYGWDVNPWCWVVEFRRAE